MKKGTPAGTQLDCGVNALFFPASTSSMSLFMCSFTHGFRLGLERSAIRKVGCLPTPLGTKGYAGSLTTGGGRRPGTGSKNGPPPLSPTHPARFDEKSGGAAFCCATADAIGAAPMRPTRMLPARTLSLHVNGDMIAPPFRRSLRAAGPLLQAHFGGCVERMLQARSGAPPTMLTQRARSAPYVSPAF